MSATKSPGNWLAVFGTGAGIPDTPISGIKLSASFCRYQYPTYLLGSSTRDFDDSARPSSSIIRSRACRYMINGVRLRMKPERSTLRSYARISTLLKERIATGEFVIGARLPPDRELTVHYDVSRPTMREALIALEVEGVVSIRPGSGVYVISKHPRLENAFNIEVDLLEILQARRVMESEASALAAAQLSAVQLKSITDHIDDIRNFHEADDVVGFKHAHRRFHQSIAEASGNVAVTSAIATLWNIRPYDSQIEMFTSTLRILANDKDFAYYIEIVDSLRSGNPDKARIEMRNAYTVIIDLILDEMESKAIDTARKHIKSKRDLYRST